MLRERLELRRLPLAVPVLKQALGLLLSEGLLVLQLHKLLVARGQPILHREVAPVFRDGSTHALQARRRGGRRKQLPPVLLRMEVALSLLDDGVLLRRIVLVDVLDNGGVVDLVFIA